MTDFERATHHRVLPTERLGDTLMITPGGSLAGYGAGEVQRELARLKRLLDDSEIESLVIDLHGADYFGSEMVGVFVRLQQACRGVTALVGVNYGMRMVFDAMRLEELFSFYPSRKHALDAIARIPMQERLHARWAGVPGFVRSAATTCALLAVLWLAWGTGVVHQTFGSPVARDYCALNDLWVDFSQLEQVEVSYEEELARRNTFNRRLERLDWRVSIRQSVLGAGGADEASFQDALKSFQAVLHNGEDPVHRSSFLHLMHCTRNNIERRTGLALPRPADPMHIDEA